MHKDVLISIRGVQKVDQDEDVIEITTLGKYAQKNGASFIIYKESEATGFDGMTTTLKVEGDQKVTMTRRGSHRSSLIIEKNARHLCHYSTDFGDLMVGVSANQINTSMGKNGGDLYFKYTLDINSSLASENEIYINIKECKQDV